MPALRSAPGPANRSHGPGGNARTPHLRPQRSRNGAHLRTRLVLPAGAPLGLPLCARRQHDARQKDGELQGPLPRKRIRRTVRPAGDRRTAVLRHRQDQRLRHLLPPARGQAGERRHDGSVDFGRRRMERLPPPPRHVEHPVRLPHRRERGRQQDHLGRRDRTPPPHVVGHRHHAPSGQILHGDHRTAGQLDRERQFDAPTGRTSRRSWTTTTRSSSPRAPNS